MFFLPNFQSEAFFYDLVCCFVITSFPCGGSNICSYFLVNSDSGTTRGGQVVFEQTVGSICIEVDIMGKIEIRIIDRCTKANSKYIVNKSYNRF